MKVFRNSEGTLFLKVNKYFGNGGSIDGNNLTSYAAAPQVHEDVFKKVLYVNPNAKPPCCLKIQSFAPDNSSFNPTDGEHVTFNGSIFANYPVTWEMSITDRLFTGGGTSVSRSWDGKDAAGSIVAKGGYSAVLTANTSEVVCTDMGFAAVEVMDGCIDQDGDGYFAAGPTCPQGNDCNDSDNTIYPGALELCDGKDNNCNEETDEPQFMDNDGDGFVVQIAGCPVPGTYDCDDEDETVYPDAPELCGDRKSNNCNAQIDEECGNECREERPSLTVATGSAGNVMTGGMFHHQALFAVSGAALFDGISLHYGSLNIHDGSLGPGWHHNFEMLLFEEPDGTVFFRNGAGSFTTYTRSVAGYASPLGDYSTLTKNTDGTWLISYRDGTEYSFDISGKPTTVSDRFNNTLSFSYTNGDLTGITDPNGRTTILSYDTGVTPHRLTFATDPNGKTYNFEYQDGRLKKVLNPLAGPDATERGYWEYTYHTRGFLTSKRDPNGNVTGYDYYPDGRLKSSLDPEGTSNPDGHTRTLLYPDAGSTDMTTTFTEKDGSVWRFTYDSRTVQLKSKTDPYGRITSYTYHYNDYMKSMTVPFDGATRLSTFYAYDPYGNLVKETEPLDLSAFGIADAEEVNIAQIGTENYPIKWAFGYTYDYADFDQLTSVSDLRSTPPVTTTYAHYSEPDGENGTWLVTRITAPGETAGATLTSYLRRYANGSLASYTDANGKTVSFTYYPVNPPANTSGMLHTITAADGVKLTIAAYDKNGNAGEFRLTGADNGEIPVRTTYGYDALNRITSILRESTSTPLRFSPLRTTFGHDNNGNINSIIDAENHETRYEYTHDEQLKKIGNTVDGILRETVLEYGGTGCTSCDGVDKLTAVKDPSHVKNNQPGTVYRYDKAGRLEYETDPLGKKLRYTYYDNGLPRDKHDVTGGEPGTLLVTYFYNSRGQLTAKLYGDNTSVSFTYKPNGLLETANNLTGTTVTFGYSFDYHDNGRLKSVTDTDGRKISYDEYDGLGRRKKVTILKGDETDERTVSYDYDGANRPLHIISAAGTFTFGYDKLGRRDTLNYPNGITADWDFDDLDRLTGLNHTGTAAIVTNGYPEHDQLGNIKTRTGDAPATYEYDELYRLKKAVTGKGTENYVYDAVGNRISGPGFKDTDYAHDDANQMTSGRKMGYAYDNYGNQISRITPNASDKTWTQDWDLENRLVKVESIKEESELKTVTFKYDPFGRRIEKKLVTVIDDVIKTSTWRYVYDNEDIVQEVLIDGNGTTKTFFTHGPGIDEPLALERGGQFYYFHTDGLGSITAITDAGRNIVQSYNYDSFGLVRPSTVFANSYTFQGREWDRETGLYYYRARYYDPLEGRFISKDPIGFAGGDVNLYGFVENNSVNWRDPLGLYTEIIIWEPYGWGGSSFGHVSANINGRNYSFGPNGWDTRYPTASEYISRQQQFRSGVGVILGLQPSEETESVACFNKMNSEYDEIHNNCGTPSKDCLAQLGHYFGYPLFPADIGKALLDSPLFQGVRFYPGPPRGFFKNIFRGDFPDAPWAR